MFLQETKTKRGGKTYISYLVRESFRTANGPRGRTICNLTHLPKEVRDMVGRALKGETLVPLSRLELNEIHSFGACLVMNDAAERFGLPSLLAPLSPRNASLVRAMIFGGLLFPPSVAPFLLESRRVRLAMYCGLDADQEAFGVMDLMGALRELDERWAEIRTLMTYSPHGEVHAIALYTSVRKDGEPEMGMVGMDAEGIPVPLAQEEEDPHETSLPAFLQQMARRPRTGAALLALDEDIAAGLQLESSGEQPFVIELGQATLAGVLRHLSQGQLSTFRSGALVEVRLRGERHIIEPVADAAGGTSAPAMRMGSLNELTSMTSGKSGAPAPRGSRPVTAPPQALRGVRTNVPPERLPGPVALEWARRAAGTRAAFSPVKIIIGAAGPGEEVNAWRNHQHLRFLTHWLRSQLAGEWHEKGESREVEEILRDLQEVHRATLSIAGVPIAHLATHPPDPISQLLTNLDLWPLFESHEEGKKERRG